ncbi:MAG: hypothetical protein ACXWYP_08365 [Pseudonocardia sp.]
MDASGAQQARLPGRDGGGPPVRTVVVDGWGLLAEELVAQLRRCDVPVRGGRYAADGAELALASWTSLPGAVVVVAEGRTPWWAGAPWQARGIPHLPVVLSGRRVVVGPLVLPGRTACLRCARPAWDTSAVTGPDTPTGGLVLAAAVATVTVLAVLRGDPSLGGISTEIALDEVSVTHRLWNVRPDCGCARVRMAV